ncbi:MAG: sulfur carrier protein ThiS [Coprothermobacterota bacterium]|nr:sulfur carrier protein ThiS [Coprothermobacterota bacterium]
MKITLNHNEVTLEGESLTVRQLLAAMRYTFPLIVVQINGEVVARSDYDSATVGDEDKVEAIHLIGGG